MYKPFIFTSLVLLLSACAGVKPFDSSLKSNVFISSKTDPGVNAVIDIYRLNKKCESSFQGRVAMDSPKKSIGLAAKQSHYLVISFTSSSFWSGQSSSMSQELWLKPSKGKTYQMNLSYIDAIYEVNLKEKSKKSREIGLEPPAECR